VEVSQGLPEGQGFKTFFSPNDERRLISSSIETLLTREGSVRSIS
jgi:hypothetical protein